MKQIESISSRGSDLFNLFFPSTSACTEDILENISFSSPSDDVSEIPCTDRSYVSVEAQTDNVVSRSDGRIPFVLYGPVFILVETSIRSDVSPRFSNSEARKRPVANSADLSSRDDKLKGQYSRWSLLTLLQKLLKLLRRRARTKKARSASSARAQ